MMLLGVLLNGVSSAVYIGAQLSAGPATAWRVSAGAEAARRPGAHRPRVIVLLTGWSLGGPLGAATVVYAIGLGPVIQLTLPLVTIPVRTVGGKALPAPGDDQPRPWRSRTPEIS